MHARLAALARALVPAPARASLRRMARRAPARLRDLPKDAACLVAPRAFGGPMPPPGLRERVGLGSRAEFELVGREGARQVLAAVHSAGTPPPPLPRADWLDFGCGCGRLARYLIETGEPRRYAGVDVDARQIRWASRNLAGRFSTMRPEPPLAFPAASFDVVLAVSIFTHYSEREQSDWLPEIARVLRPGGLLVATTHSPEDAPGCPGLTAADLAALAERGFLAAGRPDGPFNERSTFHSRAYLERVWSPLFTLCAHAPRGFVGFQDLTVWRKPPER